MTRTELVALAVLAIVTPSGAVLGQTIPERVGALERKVEEQRKGLAGALGIEIHGLVAADYLYNFNVPDSHGNQLRVFDEDANSFTLNQANLRLSRQKENEDFGFVTSLDFGKTAEVVGRATCWNHDCNSAESDNSFELREAYLTYQMPLGDGVTLKAGKFVTLHGAEVIKNYDALNYTVSNSILFGYAIPFTHTGVMASFPLGPYFTVDLGVVNGWDSVVDTNDGKSVHAGLKVEPVETFSMYFSGTYGPEQPDNGKSKRAMVTGLFTFAPTEELTFVVDANYGNESDLLPHREGQLGMRSADWYGVAGYAVFQLHERVECALRAEVFDDPDGVRTGISTPGAAPGVTVWELTPSVSVQLTEGMQVRLEYRHDEADRAAFEKDNRFQRGGDTIAAELLYAF